MPKPVDDFRHLLDEGVRTFFVSLSDLAGPEQIEKLVPLISAFR